MGDEEAEILMDALTRQSYSNRGNLNAIPEELEAAEANRSPRPPAEMKPRIRKNVAEFGKAQKAAARNSGMFEHGK